MTTEELSKLTPEEKKIRILELCGWKRTGRQDHTSPLHTTRTIQSPGQPAITEPFTTWESKGPHERLESPSGETYFLCGCDNNIELPDYLNDLNAMHEAEETLPTEHDRIVYKETLADITPPDPAVSLWGLCHATAAQRADAFLLTLSP